MFVDQLIAWSSSAINTLSIDMWGFDIKQFGSVGNGAGLGKISAKVCCKQG